MGGYGMGAENKVSGRAYAAMKSRVEAAEGKFNRLNDDFVKVVKAAKAWDKVREDWSRGTAFMPTVEEREAMEVLHQAIRALPD